MNNYDKLISIVQGGRAEEPNPEQLLAKNQIEKFQNIADNLPQIDPKDRYRMFMEKTRDWIPHPDNTEEYWAMQESLFPGNLMETMEKKIDTDLKSFNTDSNLDESTSFLNCPSGLVLS